MNDISVKENILKSLDKSFKLDQDGVASFLSIELDKYDWFAELGAEDSRSITVYANYMDKDVFKIVPDYVFGYQIKLAFIGYLLCGEKYGLKNDRFNDRTLN